MSVRPISPLRRHMLEDMAVRRLGEKTKSDYIRHMENFTAFPTIIRSPVSGSLSASLTHWNQEQGQS
jgi:hypothetical protein